MKFKWLCPYCYGHTTSAFIHRLSVTILEGHQQEVKDHTQKIGKCYYLALTWKSLSSPDLNAECDSHANRYHPQHRDGVQRQSSGLGHKV